MLRLSELKLPLEHEEDAIAHALCARLDVRREDILSLHVARRAWDARRRSDILLVYSVDFEVADEAALLRRHAGDRALTPTPDTTYRHVARAPARPSPRPVVIGTGPCGIFAALILAEMGFRPIILDRGKVVRRAHQGHLGAVAPRRARRPRSNVQFGEGGAGTFSDGKL